MTSYDYGGHRLQLKCAQVHHRSPACTFTRVLGRCLRWFLNPPGPRWTPRYSQKESISRSFTCHELKVGGQNAGWKKTVMQTIKKTGIIGLLSLSTLKTLAERMLKPAALRLLASCLFSLPRMSKPALQPGAAEKKWIGRKSHNHCFFARGDGFEGMPQNRHFNGEHFDKVW